MAPGESSPEQCPFALTNASVVAGDLAGTLLLETTVLVVRTSRLHLVGRLTGSQLRPDDRIGQPG
jgi:hypothetical protein